MALTEGKYTGEFIVSEANGARSRETGTVLSGETLVVGELVGKVATATATADAGNTGNGTSSAVTIGNNFQEGTYTLTATGATTFLVVAPNGTSLSDLTVGTAYDSQIGLTITAGGTAFVAGDIFTVAVVVGKIAAYNPAGVNGTQTVAGICFAEVDASLADVANQVFVVRDAEVRSSDLTYNEAVSGTITAEVAGLKALGIIVR